MGTTLNKDAYKKLIKEDMEKVEKYFPEHSLEKKHIQEVLRCSIECYYPCDGRTSNKESVLPISGVSVSVCDCFPDKPTVSFATGLDHCLKCGKDIKQTKL